MEEHHEEHHKKKGTLRRIYEDEYKIILFLPFILLILGMGQIAYQYSSTGDFVNRGVDLKGGVILTIEREYNPVEMSEFLKANLGGDIIVTSINYGSELSIQASEISEEELISKVEEKLGKLDPNKDYSVNSISSSLGTSFFKEITQAIIIAFVLMAIVVFITFRAPAPVFAVILCAFSDIIVTLAIFNLTGMKLGKGGIAAFLMLIGYSVDTDILLSTKMLKKKAGTVMERIYSAMDTGLAMNLTTIAAVTTAIIFTQSDIIRQIMIILIIGLIVDMINTWIQNVGILRLYLERKRHE
jgi:preprotein translocase subunit SecF